MVQIAHLIFIIFLACFATKSWGYSYDAELLVPNSVEVAFEGQNQHYDDVSKYCYRCILSSDKKLQKKTQSGSFFAFDVGLVAAKGLGKVPGRVQSRINVSNDGFDHVVSTHLNPARAGNKSQFSVTSSELRGLLSSKSTVQSSARALETGNFARTITTNRTIGNLADKFGGSATNKFTVITVKAGNLKSAFPGGL